MGKYDTLIPLPTSVTPGLIAISAFSLLSLVSCACAVTFITYRISRRDTYQTSQLRYNQSIILILNLLIADLIQAFGFGLSLHWLRIDAIIASTPACNAQGFMVEIGDVASGLFALSIAAQTFYIVVMQRNIPYKWFCWSVLGIWAFSLMLSVISPIIHIGEKLYVSTGAWCWITADYHEERLLVHYLWIFICEFGSFLLYATIFIFLRRNAASNAAAGVQGRSITRVARLMLVYPVAYTCLTLPLAAFRMASQSGVDNLPDFFLLFAGACMASCGWVDVAIYLVTRRTILKLQDHSLGSGGRSGSGENGIAMTNTHTTLGSQIRGNKPESIASSQEGFVKMEHIVEVTVEQANPVVPTGNGGSTEDSEHPPQKPMGNSTTVTGTHYWT